VADCIRETDYRTSISTKQTLSLIKNQLTASAYKDRIYLIGVQKKGLGE